MATKQHSALSGSDLHPNKVDGTTGTELTTSSEAIYDARWARLSGATFTGAINGVSAALSGALSAASAAISGVITAQGGTITPAANSTTTLVVNRQDGTTPILTVDTSNNRLQVGNGTTGTLRVGDANITKSAGSNWSIGSIVSSGNLGLSIRTVTANYSMSTGADCTVLADATSGVVTVTLPGAGGANSSTIYLVKRTNSAANNVVIATSSSQTINGASTKTLGSQYAWVMVQSNGSNWFIISQGGTVS